MAFAALLCAAVLARAEAPPAWDFRDGKDHGWKALNQVEGWTPSADGLRMRSTGDDPYIESPAFAHTASENDVVEVELECSVAGGAQLFWKRGGSGGYAEERSLKFTVDSLGKPFTAKLPVGSAPDWNGRIVQLRLDPCECAGDVRLIAVRLLQVPPPPLHNELRVEEIAVGEFHVTYTATATSSFDASVAPPTVRLILPAVARIEQGDPTQALALQASGSHATAEWNVKAMMSGVWPFAVETPTGAIMGSLTVRPDEPRSDKGDPKFERPAPSIEVLNDVRLDARGLGLFMYLCPDNQASLAGVGELVLGSRVEWPSAGAPKIAALESPSWYCIPPSIANQPSGSSIALPGVSAEAVVQSVEHGCVVRLIPHGRDGSPPVELSLVRFRSAPAASGEKCHCALLPGLEYLGAGEASSSTLDVEGPEHVRSTPDRLMVTVPMMAIAGGGSVSGVMWDPAEGISPVFDVPDRIEGMSCGLLGLRRPLAPAAEWEGKTFTFTMFTLPGDDVVKAVKLYVKTRGLPELPKAPRTAQEQAKLCVATFMDGGLWDEKACGWGHCFEPNWGRTPAADVCYVLQRIADEKGPDAERIGQRVQAVLAKIPPDQRLLQGISHVRPEAITLRLGGTLEALKGLKAQADADLAAMREDGSWKYEGKYARGHFEDTALGICAPRVIHLLRYVRMTGSPKHLDAARKGLARLDKFDLPRGAQTWEVPLHTPDILASAEAVEAFVLAFEVTGEKTWLESAERWAWTGVPFIYLWNEPGLATMRYATIPVFGATNWQAPAWFGTPVQWCGLVYAWSLYRLAAYDAQGPWKQLADGITIAGMQMQYPDGPRAGCFPDVFYLRAQQRAGPSINPTPLLINAEYMAGRNPDLEQTDAQGLRFLHLPGLQDIHRETGRLSFTVPEGAPPQEAVFVHASLAPAAGSGGSVKEFWDGETLASIISLPGPGKYTFEMVH